jgi:uncharacterized phage-associated protein
MHAFKVAEYLLYSDSLNPDSDGITNMKLQKLLYYCQGFHLAIFGKTLFDEDINKWTHGPVVQGVYFKYSEQGRNPIAPPENVDFSEISEESRTLIDEVCRVYGGYTAYSLRNLSHKELPWQDAEMSCVITNNSMRDYFRTRIK